MIHLAIQIPNPNISGRHKSSLEYNAKVTKISKFNHCFVNNDSILLYLFSCIPVINRSKDES